MIYTVGHSTYSKPERFVEVVKPHIDTILDSRSHPRAMFGHFYGNRMSEWLPKHNIKYIYEPRLGGWSKEHLQFKEKYKGLVDIDKYTGKSFPKDHIRTEVKRDFEKYWVIQGLWDVQWFMTLESFRQAIQDLIKMNNSGVNVAYMCAEVAWYNCHRAMISDYLWFLGIDTTHLHWDAKKIVKHSVAKDPQGEGVEERFKRYHPDVIKCWTEWKSLK
jgi:uncharacterized protein (DUF488 family)